jgi:hypothetical protein
MKNNEEEKVNGNNDANASNEQIVPKVPTMQKDISKIDSVEDI